MRNQFKKMKLNLDSIARFFGIFFVVFTPIMLLAQDTATTRSGLAGFFNVIRDIISNSLIPLIFALAFVYFVWGVVQYVLYPSDEGKKEKGKQYMIWGLIALTVMFSVWGLVTMIGGTFNILGNSSPAQPSLPTGN